MLKWIKARFKDCGLCDRKIIFGQVGKLKVQTEEGPLVLPLCRECVATLERPKK
jgi:hypothetical protein